MSNQTTRQSYDYKNLHGFRFGMLVVVKPSDTKKQPSQWKWECLCDCGSTTMTPVGVGLVRGLSKSCGCLRKCGGFKPTGAFLDLVCSTCQKQFKAYRSDKRKCCSKECGLRFQGTPTHGKSRTRLYSIWCGMKGRCHRESNSAWEWYGGRGIEVCSQWRESFVSFQSWAIQSGYTEKLEIDRIDGDGNYEPSNCRWVNRKQQMRNCRKPRDAKTSRYKGVSWYKAARKWKVQIAINGKNKQVSLWDDETDAALAYDEAAKLAYGEFARLNFKQ